MKKTTLLHILLILSLIVLPACSRTPADGIDTADIDTASTVTPTEFSQKSTKTSLPSTPISTPWPIQPESLAIRLDWYLEKPDGSLEFWVYVLNPNPGQVTDCVVSVTLYDGENNQLIDNQESCNSIEAYEEEWVVLIFDESFIPEDYQAYNIFAQAAAPGGEFIQGELNDSPVTGEQGVEISANRVLPEVTLALEWFLPQDTYLPGREIEAQMKTQLVQGQLDETQLCLQVVEKRGYAADTTNTVTLAESCQPAYLESEGEDQQDLNLKFLPSGYTWIQMASPTGDYVPLGISAKAQALYHGIPLAETEIDLFLPPVAVKDASWSAEEQEVNAVQPETPYLVELLLESLADDPNTHTVQLSIRYAEHDPEEWLVSGLLLFIPCLFGFCEDEAVVFTQEYQITLIEDAQFDYSLPIRLPQEPTAETGIGGYYYIAVAFDGITIWRGDKVPLEVEN